MATIKIIGNDRTFYRLIGYYSSRAYEGQYKKELWYKPSYVTPKVLLFRALKKSQRSKRVC